MKSIGCVAQLLAVLVLAVSAPAKDSGARKGQDLHFRLLEQFGDEKLSYHMGFWFYPRAASGYILCRRNHQGLEAEIRAETSGVVRLLGGRRTEVMQSIMVYDPVFHQRVESRTQSLDPRWVLCRRPCVIVGGELTPSMLELEMDRSTGVYAAPLQMKANNGLFVVDDFGRQIVSPEYLLNRWIVPLDRRVDYLSLTYGVKFEIPFQTTVVFSTNLDPSTLADEAFLRRIQNKIHVEPVGSAVFDLIFERIVKSRGLMCEPDSPAFLRKLCAQFTGKELRACYPADIINIIESISSYEEVPVEISQTNLKRAAAIYFTQTAMTATN